MRLSICIPTYNFGAFIGATLETIVPQLREGMEIVILDGGSTDETPEVVARFAERCESLRYVRQDQRGGIDRDLARNVSLAQGEYVWLFCSDDLMKPGAVDRVLASLVSGHDLYVCGFSLCTPEMRPFKDAPITRGERDAEFELGDATGRLGYFAHAQTTPAVFSFAGSLIFRKSFWDRVDLNEEFVGSCWAHVARLFELMPRGCRLKFLTDSYLDKRTDNDSFMESGIIRRYALAIDGYNRLADTFFGAESGEAREIRRVVRNEFPPWILLNARMESLREGRAADVPLLDRLAATAYCDRTFKNRLYQLIYRYTPVSVFRSGLAGYRAARAAARPLSTRRQSASGAASDR